MSETMTSEPDDTGPAPDAEPTDATAPRGDAPVVDPIVFGLLDARDCHVRHLAHIDAHPEQAHAGLRRLLEGWRDEATARLRALGWRDLPEELAAPAAAGPAAS